MEEKRVHKLVLTGGPCGGKTTAQGWLFNFFNNLGWKVLLVPETATVLLGGGIKFSELNEEQAYIFQENLLKTMLQMENTFFEVARGMSENCLVICDRGAMDASAFMRKDQWEQMITANGWNNAELGKNRYHQVIHLVTAADGAEEFYTTEDHSCRSETSEMAREIDNKNSLAWKGHPCFDVIDNSRDFDTKMCRVIQCVCRQLGIYTGDKLEQFMRIMKCLAKDQLHET